MIPALTAEQMAKLLFGLGFAVCFFLLGMGVHKVFADRKLIQQQVRMEKMYADAQKARADAEADARQREDELKRRVAVQTAQQIADADRSTRAIGALNAANGQLRQQIDRYTRDGQAAATSCAAASDVQQRIATLGVLLGEADGLAADSAVAADTLRDQLSLCRGYVKAVTQD